MNNELANNTNDMSISYVNKFGVTQFPVKVESGKDFFALNFLLVYKWLFLFNFSTGESFLPNFFYTVLLNFFANLA